MTIAHAIHEEHRWRKVAGVVLALAVVAAAFVFVMPRIANYHAVWQVVQRLSWQQGAALVAVTCVNLATDPLPWAAAVPGLSVRRAFLVTQASTAATYVAPAGDAVGPAVTYGILRDWGFTGASVTLAVALTGTWNALAQLGVPCRRARAAVARAGALRAPDHGRRHRPGGPRRVRRHACAGARAIATSPGVWATLPPGWPTGRGACCGVTRSPGRGRRSSASATRPSRCSVSEGGGSRSQRSPGSSRCSRSCSCRYASSACRRARSPSSRRSRAWSLVRLLSAMPITPGGVGIVEVGLTSALVAFGGRAIASLPPCCCTERVSRRSADPRPGISRRTRPLPNRGGRISQPAEPRHDVPSQTCPARPDTPPAWRPAGPRRGTARCGTEPSRCTSPRCSPSSRTWACSCCSSLQSILLMLFVSVVLAAAVSRPTAMLERRRHAARARRSLLIQFGVVAVLLALAWFVVPPLVNQLASFTEHLPGYVDRFQGLRRDYAKIRARYPELGPFDQEVAKLADRVGGDRRAAADRPSAADFAAALRAADGAGAHDAARASAQPDARRTARTGLAVAPRQDRAGAHEDRRAHRGIRAGEGDRHGDRRQPDVPGARRAERAVRRAPRRDRRVRRGDSADRAV